MSVLELLTSVFAPHICLGCGAEQGQLLCAACAETVSQVPPRCYHCQATADDYGTCREHKLPLVRVLVATYHKDLAKSLIHHAKYDRAQAGLAEMAGRMAPLLRLEQNVLLVHVPTATSRVRQRGYDHARVVARHLSRLTTLPHATHLARLTQAHQVGANRVERLAQLAGAFRVVGNVRGKHIMLVDDVLTTGATLETAARTLKKAGAASVSAIVFAQA